MSRPVGVEVDAGARLQAWLEVFLDEGFILETVDIPYFFPKGLDNSDLLNL
jgi:hypothetical protein